MDVYEVINGIVTHLIVWGDVFGSNEENVILCILGCPGISLFYKEFGAEVHKITNLPVCVIGHAGHHAITKEQRRKLSPNKKSYDINNQINHKLTFINTYIKGKRKLHLIGHSLGAWLLVEMLDNNEELLSKVESVHLLFPTLQKLTTTPMGRYVNLIRNIHCLAVLCLIILELIPLKIRIFLTHIFLRLSSLPQHYTERILLYLKPGIADKSLKLAYELLDKSIELNKSAIDKIKDMTYVVYAKKDPWVPLLHVDDLKIYQPQLQMKLIEVDHAFVLKSSSKVAKIVSDFIQNKKKM